jgi:hypothetical protein
MTFCYCKDPLFGTNIYYAVINASTETATAKGSFKSKSQQNKIPLIRATPMGIFPSMLFFRLIEYTLYLLIQRVDYFTSPPSMAKPQCLIFPNPY